LPREILILVAVAACSAPATPPDAPASPWFLAPVELPSPRLEPGVAALGQRLVIAGGFDSNLQAGLTITKEVDVLEVDLDPSLWMFTRLSDLPIGTGWTHLNLAGIGTTLYLLGGLEGTDFIARGDAFALDTTTSTVWRILQPMPPGQERGAAGIVVSPPHIFLLGGASTTAALATVLDYNIATNTWSRLPDLPSPRSHPAAMRQVDGTLIVAGGLATLDATQPLSEVLALPLGATQWEPRASMPTARGGCAYGVALGFLVCAGGEAGGAALSVVEAYDPVSNVWFTLPPMPVERAGTQGAMIGQRLFVPGGAATLTFNPTATLYVLSLLDTVRMRDLGSP
jgi:hypothetical protein